MSSSRQPPAPTVVFLDRLRSFLGRPLWARLWRYGAVSLISTAVSLIGLFVFYRVIKVGSAGEANIIAASIATIPSYYLNRHWAWGRSGHSSMVREVAPFWAIAALSLAASTYAVEVASHEAHLISSSRAFQTGLVEAANVTTYAVIWVGKFLLFNKVLFKERTNASPGALGARSGETASEEHVIAG